MPLSQQTVDEALPRRGSFNAIIDVRSPSEFADDHLPGALNWPVLDDAERAIVGTLYVQVSPFEARKRGSAIVARRIAEHIEREIQDKPRDWQPLVYCWRGGERSGAMAYLLAQIGLRVVQLKGGYKAYRARVREDLLSLPGRLRWCVVGGRTGSGKTRLLHALAAQGAQVLDLEALAAHRGSVLGRLPGQPQPRQKAFESALWSQLQAFDPARPVFIESESARIGQLRVPEALLAAMHGATEAVHVQLDLPGRIALLLDEYAFFTEQVGPFCDTLDALIELRGRATVERWQAQARAGQWPDCLAELLERHYDPLYDRSILRDFPAMAQARALPVAGPTVADFAQAAAALLSAGDAPT